MRTRARNQRIGINVVVAAIPRYPKITVRTAALLGFRCGAAAVGSYITRSDWFRCAGRTKMSTFVWEEAVRMWNELLSKHSKYRQ